MATKYKRAGSGNWSDDTQWSLSSGGPNDTTKPTAADDVKLDASSGAVTIDVASVCRSLDCTGFTGTLTHNAVGLTIGDATAGLSNIALKLVSGMTYTLVGGAGSTITFVSTSATQQTVEFGGKSTGNLTFNASSGGSWIFSDNHTTSGAVTLTKGSLDVNGKTCSWGTFSSSNTNTRSLTLGAATIGIAAANQTCWDIGTTTGLTLSAASSTINFSAPGQTFTPGASQAYGTVNMTGSGIHRINSTGATFINLNRTGTASKSDSFEINGAKTVTGILTLAGNSAVNRLFVLSPTDGITTTITNTGATMTWSNVDFQDIAITSAFDASAITGKSGDCGGNSGITFTTSATQTWSGTAGGNWSANAWTTRVPLPQDDVVVSSAFAATPTITWDMPRVGRSIDFTGTTGNPSISTSSIANSIFGSLTLSPSMTIGGSNTTAFRGRGSFTITSNKVRFGQIIIQKAPGGTYTLQDDMYMSSYWELFNGTFDANGFNMTARQFAFSNTTTRGLVMGTGTWTTTTTTAGEGWSAATVTGLTFSGANARILISGKSSAVRLFAGGGLTYGTVILTGTSDLFTVTGSNVFSSLMYEAPQQLNNFQFASAGNGMSVSEKLR